MANIDQTIQPFLDAGFKKFPKNDITAQYAEFGLQKRIRDEQGTKYFVTLFVYDFSNIPNYPNPEKISFNLEFQTESRLLGKTVDIDVTVVSPEDALETAKKIWLAFDGEYYEVDY
jgi:hypothetical protein